jgi:hypothetical protein
LPHLLQNAWPGCTAPPHPSQNIDASIILVRLSITKQLSIENTNLEPKSSAYLSKLVYSRGRPQVYLASLSFSIFNLHANLHIEERMMRKRKGHPATGRPFLKGE